MVEDATPGVRRADEDDNDLLTYSEVAVRVDEEIAAVRQEIAALRGAADAADRIAGLESRIADLRDAATRNSRRRINEENFEKFFGYVGTPRHR
ncbi:hypothetical protein [Nocardia jinanensis]|uniref:Acyl-CoA synthase n=1 Tax=Nocardia jinanensis TaxID=382504 RepID=A0A917RKA5_9NOCA|nr:hypothetical protein [Nocardia jinanensis]GGL12621.1 hypothetical protein GCM10011588_28800 [Nocardia jinanensis]